VIEAIAEPMEAPRREITANDFIATTEKRRINRILENESSYLVRDW
jgi:hypothetical protein